MFIVIYENHTENAPWINMAALVGTKNEAATKGINPIERKTRGDIITAKIRLDIFIMWLLKFDFLM